MAIMNYGTVPSRNTSTNSGPPKKKVKDPKKKKKGLLKSYLTPKKHYPGIR